MANEKIQVSWDELETSKVDKHVKQQEAMARNREYAKLQVSDLTDSSGATGSERASIFYHPVVSLALFGFFGGLLAWGCGELLHLRQNPIDEAHRLIGNVQQIRDDQSSGRLSEKRADASIEQIRQYGKNNPYLQVFLDPKLSESERQTRLDEIRMTYRAQDLMTDILWYGICGMLIAGCLSIAEPLLDRNMAGAVKNGTIGAALGLLGGLAVSLFVNQLYSAVGSVQAGGLSAANRQLVARAAAWGILGCSLALAPGLVMRNLKRLSIGVLGGAIGGLIGGVLYDFVIRRAGGNHTHLSRLAAVVPIGLITGMATGLIEFAAKTGWLKVTTGLIAGKQFILYRNPTFIGSAPDSQIYLFRDPSVGRRHAAIHILKGGFEIENLPLGSPTLVNGDAVERKRLKNGDRIKIGNTTFSFQEKTKLA